MRHPSAFAADCHLTDDPARELELGTHRVQPLKSGFSCTNAERAQVQTVLGRVVTEAELRHAVGTAVAQAQRDARVASRALRVRPRSVRTSRIFRSIFNVPLTFVPAWRPGNASWLDLGELVALRIENGSRILGGGYMHFFCWGSAARCPECTEPPTSYRACSSYQGRHHICLGREWWEWYRNGHRGFMASTLLHEAMHIYFRLEHHKATVGRPSVNNIYCYDTLIAIVSGRTPKPGDRDKCASKLQPSDYEDNLAEAWEHPSPAPPLLRSNSPAEAARFGEFLLESAVADRGGEQLSEESSFGGEDLAGEEFGEDERGLLANEWESRDAPGEPWMEQFEGSEHKAIGDKGSGGAKTALVAGAASKPLTFGDIVALAGDMYASYYDLAERSRTAAGRAELAWALWYALQVRGAPEPPAADTVKKKVTDRYYLLAAENISHFSAGGTGMQHYMKWHSDAMANALFAGQNGDDHQWRIAVGKEAFSDHYLTDLFAAGHVRTPRAEIKEWYKQHGLGSSTPFVDYMAAFMLSRLRGRNRWLNIPIVSGFALGVLQTRVRDLGGEALQSFSLGDIVSLALHNHDNEGLDVVSKVDATGRRHANGYRWRAIGDGHLLKAQGVATRQTPQTVEAMRQTREMVTAAVVASFRDLVRVRDAGRRIGKRNLTSPAKAQAIKQALKGNLFPALAYVPKEDTTKSKPTPMSADGRADLEWRWGQLGKVTYDEVNNVMKNRIMKELAAKVETVDDPAPTPVGIKIDGTRPALKAFVDHLAEEGIRVLVRAVKQPAR